VSELTDDELNEAIINNDISKYLKIISIVAFAIAAIVAVLV
jgi:hypothetical protein